MSTLTFINRSTKLTWHVIVCGSAFYRKLRKVQFYDARFKKKGFDPELGQLAASYLVSDILNDAKMLQLHGLDLGSAREWRIDPEQMAKVIAFVREQERLTYGSHY